MHTDYVWFETKTREECALDLGPWEQVFSAEFDGQRRKRVIVKVMGDGGRRRT